MRWAVDLIAGSLPSERDAVSGARIGADVGGTFTDVICVGDGRPRRVHEGALDAAGLRPRGRLGRGRARRPARRSTASCTARPSPRTPCSNAAARGSRSSRPRASATCSSCGGCACRTSTTTSGRSRRRSSPRRDRFEIAERMAADGTVVKPLDEDEARALAARLADGRRRGGRGLPAARAPPPRARAAARRDPARRSCPASRSRSRARSRASSRSTSAPRPPSSTPTSRR